jgi:hypothetical protein
MRGRFIFVEIESLQIRISEPQNDASFQTCECIFQKREPVSGRA